MAVKGIQLTTWLGWWFGVILLRHPWGKPSFPSWCTFSTLYSIIFLAMYIFIMIDSLVNNSESLYQDDKHKFGRLVRAFGLAQYTCFTLLKRISFFTNAKKLGRLMEILHRHDEERKDGKQQKQPFKISIDLILRVSTYVLSLVTLCTKGVHYVRSNLEAKQLLNSLGTAGFSIVYYIFALIPLTIVTNSAFSIIIVITQKAAKIFCDFCNEVSITLFILVHHQIDHPSESQVQVFDIFRAHQSRQVTSKQKSCFLVNKSKIHQMQKEFMKLELVTRQDIIDKFENVKELLKLTNEALSSLLLWFICGITFNLVTTASQLIVTGSHGKLNLLTDILILVINGIFLYTLQVGHRIWELQRKAKLILHRNFLSLPWSQEKIELEDVIVEIVEYEWNLSGCGFFNVNRRLASGIFTLILNYVVIFVQLNIALTETPPVVCPDKNTTTINSTSLLEL